MLKNFLKLTFIISAFLNATHSPEVLAQQGQQFHQKQIDAVAFLPVGLWMNELKSMLMGSQIELSNQITQYRYTSADSNMYFVSEQVILNSKITTQFANAPNSQLYDMKLQLDQANVQANNFDLQVLVKKDLGFGAAVLKLDMHCDSVAFQLQNQNQISAQIKIEKGQFQLSQINWDLKNSKIQTHLIGCKEVAGFDELLKQEIQQALEQSFLLEALKQMISSQLTSLVQDKINDALSEYATKYNVIQNQTHQFDEFNNLWIFSGNSLDGSFSSDVLQKVKQSTKASLLIKKSNVENTAKQLINDYLIKNKVSSENISALKKLTCSRFIQFFLWPSLRSLSKCFEMSFQTQVTELKIIDFKNLNFQMKVGSWVSGDSRSLAYFEANLSSSLLNPKVTMNSFSGIADPDFIKWSGKSKRISINLIQPSLEEFLKTSLLQISESNVFKIFHQNAIPMQISSEILLVELQ